MALKNYVDYDGLLYWKTKFQTWISSKFALKTEIPSTLPADGGNADTVNGHTVAKDVPSDAKFTDTVYTHPANHSASMITEDTTHRFITDAEQMNYEAAVAHSKASHAPTTAERNVVIGIQKNGADVSVNAATRKVNITVPTKTSELSNDSSFVNTSAMNKAINDAVAGIIGMEFVILGTGQYNVSTLVPTDTGAAGKIYLVPNGGATPNTYTEWVWVNSKYEKLGDTAIDLSGYLKSSDLVPLTNAQIDEIMSAS